MARRAIVLSNLGSPDSPATGDVRRYLNEFLMDERVLDIPWMLRRVIVSLFILPKRPAQSAEAYASIWWDEGSPLVVISRRVTDAVGDRLDVPVTLGMRYGNPSIAASIEAALDAAGDDIEELFFFPLYPHYAMSTVETAVVEATRALDRRAPHVRLRVQPPFFDHPRYIEALVESARPHLGDAYDHLLFSYHGLPERHLKKTDPTGSHCLSSADCCAKPSAAFGRCYRAQCFRTTEAFVERAQIDPAKVSIAFQSRLGRDPWLKPFTDVELVRLAQEGTRRLVVMCPAFVSDCLETLEEIGMRGRETFMGAGGESFTLVPCLNDHPKWIDAVTEWCRD